LTALNPPCHFQNPRPFILSGADWVAVALVSTSDADVFNPVLIANPAITAIAAILRNVVVLCMSIKKLKKV